MTDCRRKYAGVANEKKRPFDPWNHHTTEWLLNRLKEEVAELEEAIRSGLKPEDIIGECIDVAIFSWFIKNSVKPSRFCGNDKAR
jgi:NTP pyrophosphatase (non-canonical NTP hydrolase)